MAHLGVTRDTARRWIDRQGAPAHDLGKLWKFRAQAPDDWARSGGARETSLWRMASCASVIAWAWRRLKCATAMEPS